MVFRRLAVGAVACASVLAGCAWHDRAAATWDLATTGRPGPTSTQFTASVSRLGCNNGVTGTVNEPEVRMTEDAVVVTFTVSPGKPMQANCPGNDVVPYVVVLPQPLGDRSLVDGVCESSEAATTSSCRWTAVRG